MASAASGPDASADPAGDWAFALQESLVLLIPGVILIGLGLYFNLDRQGFGPTRWPVWEVLMLLGVIATVGGFISVFADDEPDGIGWSGGRPYPEVVRLPLAPGELGTVRDPGIPPAPERPALAFVPSLSVTPDEPSVPLSAVAGASPDPEPRRPRRILQFTDPEEAFAEIDDVEALLRASRRRMDRSRRV